MNLTDLLLIAIGLAGLFVGGESLIRSSSRLAVGFGVPSLIIGLTVVALGTSMPELVVSTKAAVEGSTALALGSILGSNIANIGLILGLAGLIRPLTIHASLLRREIPLMVGISFAVFLLAQDGWISQFEGVLLLAGYVVFTVVLYRLTPRNQPGGSPQLAAEVETIGGTAPQVHRLREFLFAMVSIVILVISAQFTVEGAKGVALALGISELIIGLTLVAVGTSLPEIVTSLIATRRGHDDLAIGNAIGSNIANLLVILGLTAILLPVPVPESALRVDMPVMLAFAVVILLLSVRQHLPRWTAGLLLLGYLVFVIATFVS